MSKIFETKVLSMELKRCIEQYIKASMDLHAVRRKVAEDAHNNPENFKANSHSFLADMTYLKASYIVNEFIAPKHVKCIEKSLKGFMKDQADPVTVEMLRDEAMKLVYAWLEENTPEVACEGHACGDLPINDKE